MLDRAVHEYAACIKMKISKVEPNADEQNLKIIRP